MNSEKEQKTSQELVAVLSKALARQAAGEDPRLDELCAANPEWRARIEQALGESSRLPQLQNRATLQDPFLGRTLGDRYRIDARIGAGAMGLVYRAHDLELERDVAIKLLSKGLLIDDRAEERFEREATALARIAHPNVVGIYDRGSLPDGSRFLVMEFLEGMDLARLAEVRASRVPGPEDRSTGFLNDEVETGGESNFLRLTCRWFADLAAGLAVVHEQGLNHRDVKPSNIFLTSKGRPVLLDFGIALADADPRTTRENSALGTPSYMAPEALDPRAKQDARRDVYGLCASLYQVITLQAPFDGTPEQVLVALATTDAPLAHRLVPNLPPDLVAILAKGMARKPANRYPTVRELEEDLRMFLELRPVRARRIGPLDRVWRGFKRSRAWQAGVGVALASLLLFGGLELNAWRKARHAERFAAAWIQIPAGLVVGEPRWRDRWDSETRAEIAELLDEAVYTSTEPFPALLWRASFRMDGRDYAGAATDMRAIAKQTPGALAPALADLYEKLASEGRGLQPEDLEGLPAAETGEDHYLSVFHRVRVDFEAPTGELLEDPRLEDHWPSLEFGLSALSRKPRAMQEACWRLEQLTGFPTPDSQHWLVISKILEGDYLSARDIGRLALQASPHSRRIGVNVGWAYWRLRKFEDAEVHYRKATEQLPDEPRAWENLVRTLAYSEQFEEAQSVVRGSVLADDPIKSNHFLGFIDFRRALREVMAQREDEAVSAAQRALDYFGKAEQAGGRSQTLYRGVLEPIAGVSDKTLFGSFSQFLQKVVYRAALKALAESTEETSFGFLAKYIEQAETLNPIEIQFLAKQLPVQFSSEDREDLRSLLITLAKHLDDQNPR